MKTVIMAGGRGTRISSLYPDIPKPLIPIDGIPVLEREICSLRDPGLYRSDSDSLPYGRQDHGLFR